MTCHAIRRIIFQLRDEGRPSAIVTCPICEGGTRKRRTLSVDLRDGVWLYLCHRGTCPTKGAVPANGEDFIRTKPEFTPRPMTWPLRFPERGDPIGDRVFEKIDRPLRDFALRHALRVHAGDPTTHVWQCWGIDRGILGHVSRDEKKTVLTWRTDPRPIHSAYFPTEPDHRLSVIVEDPLSAALLAEDGIVGIALLGTNLPDETARSISLADNRGLQTIVALDPDDAGRHASQRIVDKLRNLGVNTAMWRLDADVKNMTRAARLAMIQHMIEVRV